MVFLLELLYSSSNLLNNLFRTSRIVLRGQEVTEDPYFTWLRSKFEFHVSYTVSSESIFLYEVYLSRAWSPRIKWSGST